MAMKKIFVWASLVLLAAAAAASAQDVKPAKFAGQFYDNDAARLAAGIDSLLTAAGAPPAAAKGRIAAVVVPHAGYVFSAPTAARAYAAVQGGDYETVIIVGPSHRVGFEGCSIWPRGGFETPLGVAAVDEDLARALSRASGFGFVREAFAEEHSVEVQVPFVQRVLPKARIVPVVMGFQTRQTIHALAAGLIKACSGKHVLVVASTDMSHYLPPVEGAKTDAQTIALIQSLKVETLIRRVEAGENILCGGGPVAAALLYAQKLGPVHVEVLKHADSSEGGGPADQVVGYFAGLVIAGEGAPAGTFALTGAQKTSLLRLARTAVTEYVTHRTVVEDNTGDAALAVPRGVFVTLRKKGDLRGCIGYIEPVAPLARAVIETAIYAAAEDPRFPPVGSGELKDIDIEISVLTPAQELTNPLSVVVGRHGLIIEKGGRRGVLLPQVPVENGWDRDTFLEQICVKAGLPTDAWRSAKLQTFEAIVFHE
jgi:hypothetical protein